MFARPLSIFSLQFADESGQDRDSPATDVPRQSRCAGAKSTRRARPVVARGRHAECHSRADIADPARTFFCRPGATFVRRRLSGPVLGERGRLSRVCHPGGRFAAHAMASNRCARHHADVGRHHRDCHIDACQWRHFQWPGRPADHLRWRRQPRLACPLPGDPGGDRHLCNTG